jgi:hypothetical protein
MVHFSAVFPQGCWWAFAFGQIYFRAVVGIGNLLILQEECLTNAYWWQLLPTPLKPLKPNKNFAIMIFLITQMDSSPHIHI